MDRPENAAVLAVDEKPHIRALERAQGWLRLPDGKALTGFSHGYKRHGTTTRRTVDSRGDSSAPSPPKRI